MNLLNNVMPEFTGKTVNHTFYGFVSMVREHAGLLSIAAVAVLLSGCASLGLPQAQSESTVGLANDAVEGSSTNMAKAANGSTMPVSLAFAAEFGGKPYSCDTDFEGIGTSQAAVTVSDYKLYVSRVRMIDKLGNETPVVLDADGLWQQQDVALLDFENGAGNCSNGTTQTNSQITGVVAKGEYTGVAFDIGVPFDINHKDPTLAASPMNLTSMFWNWRGGYRFMRIDLATNSPTSQHSISMNHDSEANSSANAYADMRAKMRGVQASGHGGKLAEAGRESAGGHKGGRGWSLHVGSTGCTSSAPTTAPSSCQNPNRIQVAFDRFNPVSDTLIIDPAEVLTMVDVSTNTPETAPGCMSSPGDPECGDIFSLLGLDQDGFAQQLIRVR